MEDLKSKMLEVAELLYADIKKANDGDVNAKDRVGIDVMALNAFANAVKAI